jgi:molecular chaperone DnaK (HSP70)
MDAMSSGRTRVGIDWGTTHTVLAVEGVAVHTSDGHGHPTAMPSVLSYPPSGQVLIGEPARRRRSIDPANTIVSAKRILGRPWHAYEVASFRKHYPIELVRIEGDWPAFRTRGGDIVPASVARELVSAATRSAGIEPGDSNAVLTVPAEFDETRREVARTTLAQCGFAHVEVLDEPQATALAHLASTAGQVVAVYDLGGGTFDFAVVDCSQGGYRVVTHAGDPYLGGDDVDRALAEWAADALLKREHWDARAAPEHYARLVAACEQAKIQLGEADAVELELGEVAPGLLDGCRLRIDRDVLMHVSKWILQQTFQVCDHVLGQAGIRPGHINTVLVAGGGTMLPGLQHALGEYFGSPPVCLHDPREVVAIGASLGSGPATLQT